MSYSVITLHSMTCRIRREQTDGILNLVSDVDGSQWKMKLDYLRREAVIFPVLGSARDYSIYTKKRLYIRFPRQKVLEAE